jgi:hypothetical protein
MVHILTVISATSFKCFQLQHAYESLPSHISAKAEYVDASEKFQTANERGIES